jgi:hypothetical protein
MRRNRLVGVGIIIAAAILIGSAFYTSYKKEGDELFAYLPNEESGVPVEQSDYIVGYVPEEDGKFNAYIKRIYTDSGATIIEADYFQTLRGKKAALRAINGNSCYSENLSKEQMLQKTNALKDDEEFEDKFYELQIGCFYNGIWLDVNDNTKIRTFDVALTKPILMTYVREEYGPHQQQGVESAWVISMDTLKKIVAGSNYDIPFLLTVSGGKITEIQEIYRP